MENFASCDLRKFQFIPCNLSKYWGLPPDNLSKFQFTPCHIIDFVQLDDLGGYFETKIFYKDRIQFCFTGDKPGNDLY